MLFFVFSYHGFETLADETETKLKAKLFIPRKGKCEDKHTTGQTPSKGTSPCFLKGPLCRAAKCYNKFSAKTVGIKVGLLYFAKRNETK